MGRDSLQNIFEAELLVDVPQRSYGTRKRLRFVHDPNHKSLENDFTQSLGGSTSVTKTITATSKGVLSIDFYVFDLFMDDYNYKIEHVDNGNAVLYSGSFSPDGDSDIHSLVVGPGIYKFTGEAVDSGEPIVGSNGTFAFTSYDIYTYTKYDELDRPIETGEYAGRTSFSSANPDTDTFPTSENDASIQYYYDGEQAYSGSLTPQNMKGRLSKVSYRDLSTTSDWGYTYYSYNTLGLVEWVIQDLPGLSEKVVEYSYDELGRLTQLDYQADSTDAFYQRYTYDALGRMTKVETSTNGSTWVKDAEYTSFFADGQVGQMKLGNSAIQTVDYAYTVQGWLDKINNGSISTGTNGDRFGMNLDYDFNGNIDLQEWRQVGTSGTNQNLLSYSYSYDNANRLTAADFSGSGFSSNAFDLEWMNYDKNGNITQYFRRDNTGNPRYDGIGYFGLTYETGTNRLDELVEQIDYLDFDIDHDASGNMIKNELQGFTSVDYDWRNLPAQMIAGSSTLQYAYDAEGNRVKKKVVGGTETHYVRGARGETIAIYQADTLVSHNILAGADIVGNHKNGYRKYFLKDHLRSVRTTVDDAGVVIGYDDYYPFGLVMPGRSSNSANSNDNYKFTGYEKEDDAELNLFHAGNRILDPILGRFMQIDRYYHKYPSMSTYQYTANNPVNFIDVNGDSINVASEYQNDLREDLKNVFGDKAKDFSFDKNGNLKYNGSKKGLSRKQRKILNGLQKLMDSPEITSIMYEHAISISGSVVNADENGGGVFIPKQEEIGLKQNIILISPTTNEQTKNIFAVVGNTIKAATIKLNRTSILFHEIGHNLYQGNNEQYKVIDFENRVRRIIKLETRPYDVEHNKSTIKTTKQ